MKLQEIIMRKTLYAFAIVASFSQAVVVSHAAGPLVNSTVFYTNDIANVTAITKVFGNSQKITEAIIEFNEPILASSVTTDSFSVNERNISNVYVSDFVATDTAPKDGRFVHIMLNPADEAAIIFAAQVDIAAQIVVTQNQPVQSVSGQEIAAPEKPLINTRQTNLLVDDFQTLRFKDPETGLLLDYNLYIPKNLDPDAKYPLVLFMHDAGVTGTNPRRTLQQGLGAVAFASEGDQAKHPSFVLAPQYPVAIANDVSQNSDYPDITVRLIEQLTQDYAIDIKRIYTTGQSGGCMTSIALNIKYPDLFAASLLVAGQWDATQTATLAQDNLWVIVSEDDAKAYPGMQAIMEVLSENGAKITEDSYDAKWSAAEFEQAIAATQAKDADNNVYFTHFTAGSVLEEGQTDNPGAGHVNTWAYAYDVAPLRDWLFTQTLNAAE